MDDSAHRILLERPRFGEFVRQQYGVSADQLESCLAEQRRVGGRLGELLVRRGLIDANDIPEILRRQAGWVAAAIAADVAPLGLPWQGFFSLCMPAFNEADNIQAHLAACCAILPEFVSQFEIVVLDDGSRDQTAACVERFAEFDPRVRLVRHDKNRGYGAAVASALRATRGDVVMFTDSDGQFSLLDLPPLLCALCDCDVVVGYRFHRAEGGIRRFNAWAWKQLVRLVLGVKIRDLDCAFKLFRREVVEQLEMSSAGAAISAEIMAQCTHGGLEIRELPVNHYERHHGRPTGANLRVIAKAFRELAPLWRHRRHPKPITSRRGIRATTRCSSDEKSAGAAIAQEARAE